MAATPFLNNWKDTIELYNAICSEYSIDIHKLQYSVSDLSIVTSLGDVPVQYPHVDSLSDQRHCIASQKKGET